MFIQTESTPNPATMKFLPGREVMREGSADFADRETAERSNLARRLFAIDGVEGVFLGSDFITVTKAAGEWHHLKPAVLAAIMDHFVSGESLLIEGSESALSDHAAHDGEDAEIVDQIIELLDTRVRPAVAADGGDIVFQGFSKGVVYLHLRGSCSGCPSSTMTLKNGIENMLRHYVPEVVEVRAVA
jgi:Fe-S cluster biogenesis protein NfuA